MPRDPMAPTPRHDGPPPGVHEDGQPAPSSPEADALATLHSLHVHQEELRLQNEELQAARADLAASLRRYVDLFELSPVGLATLQPSGLVREVNRRGRELLPMMSKSGLGPPLPDLVCASSRDTLHSAIGDTARRARPRHVEVSVPTSSGRIPRCIQSAGCNVSRVIRSSRNVTKPVRLPQTRGW